MNKTVHETAKTSNILSGVAAAVLLCFMFATLPSCMSKRDIDKAVSMKGVSQPEQPESGPGGSDYVHAQVKVFHYGEGDGEYWIFEPADPAPASAPVVAFLHGWSCMSPKMYGAWIKHIVMRGNIVIFPRYQKDLKTKSPVMYSSAITAIKDAVGRLSSEAGHVRPQLDRFAVVGHSLGAMMTANLAVDSGTGGLPRGRAFMSVEPGDSKHIKKRLNIKRSIKPLMMDDYSGIPEDAFVLVIAGADDEVVREGTAEKLFSMISAEPQKNKKFIVVQSDSRGSPPLKATHFFPIAHDMDIDTGGPYREKIRERIKERRERRNAGESRSGDIDAFDYYVTWRLFDALTDCAFYEKNCEYAVKDGPKLRGMGKWSDGTPVKPLIVKDSTE